MPDTADRTGCYARQMEPRHRPLRPPPPARSTRKRGTRHPPRRSLTRRRPHRTVRLTPGMRCAIPGHHHPQYRQEHHPEDHLLDGPPPLMPDQPPDSSNCRDEEQGNDHALIVVAVTGPCKPPLRPWMRPEGRASAPHDSPSSSGQTQARQPLTITAGNRRAIAPSAAAPPDLTRTHHEHMTTRPTRRQTSERRRGTSPGSTTRPHSGRRGSAKPTRSTAAATGRAPTATTPPSPTSPRLRQPRVFHLAETYDPEDQFVVVIRDLPRIGIYKACMVSDSEIAFLN
jgi:hypothetical protein